MMGINSTRSKSRPRLAMLALLTLCFAQLPARAQHSGTHALYQDVFIPPIGLAPDQSLRLTLFNPDGPPVRAQARSHHPGGILVVLGDGSVRAGAFHSFDVHHRDLLVAGEAGTGRIQLCASVRLTFSEAIQPMVISMEVFSITDGTSNTVFFSETLPSAPGSDGGRDVLIGGVARDVLMGIVPGQTLRVTLFNPQVPGADYVPSRIILFESGGREIAQSPELVIPPGEFRSVDFNRKAISLAGERGTNRAQVRIKPYFNFAPGRLSPVLASFEIVENSTGKTVVLSGSECLVFFLGGAAGQSER